MAWFFPPIKNQIVIFIFSAVHSGCRRNRIYKKGWLLRFSSSTTWLDISFLGYPCGAAAASIVFLGILMQLLLQLFPWTFLCSAASSVSLDILVQLLLPLFFLGHSCAAAASIVFLGTFLCSCCFNCFSWDILVQLLLQLFFLGHSCSATASIVFLDILMQLLLQLFFLGHSCAAASSRFNTM